jgi:predicted nucleotide-binding protein (sugar kinase/HSP70/actin superfamily)
MNRVLGIVVAVVVLAGVRAAFAPSINSQISSACDEINKTCPKMADEVTRLDKCVPGNMQITYNYTLLKIELNQEQLDAMQPLITANAKGDAKVKELLDKGIKMTYCFHDEEGKVLKQFDVTK